MQSWLAIMELVYQVGPEDGLQTVLDIASQVTVVGLLVVILLGGAREKPWWVFGTHHRAQVAYLTEELKIWRALALKSATVSEGSIQATALALEVAERQAAKAQGQGG